MVGEKRIVIIEDDAMIRDTLREALVGEGFPVVAFDDGTDAIQAMKNGLEPSLIILDLMMPIMSGWEFLELKKANLAWAGIPVIVTSAMFSNYAREEATLYLDKPFELDHMIGWIREKLDHPAVVGAY